VVIGSTLLDAALLMLTVPTYIAMLFVAAWRLWAFRCPNCRRRFHGRQGFFPICRCKRCGFQLLDDAA
jgi:rRNA maturation endonuclease Nob1